MKALSVWQPWASLIRPDTKTIESRDWTTRYRGELLIHASKRWTEAERLAANRAARALERFGLPPLPDPLPLGCVVALTVLTDSRAMREAPDPINAEFGHYGEGRAGWTLEDIRVLHEPVPWRGAQGLWNVSAELERLVREAIGKPVAVETELPLFVGKGR